MLFTFFTLSKSQVATAIPSLCFFIAHGIIKKPLLNLASEINIREFKRIN